MAVPTGSVSGWVALDIDGRHDGFTSFVRLHAMLHHRLHDLHQDAAFPLPATRVARTGSGLHLIFQPPQAGLRNTVEYAGFAGIDLRGDGGYIVVAPSLHPNGRRYRWSSLLPPAPFPPLLLDLVRQQERLRRLEVCRQVQQPESQQVGRQEQAKQHERHSRQHGQQDPDYWLAKAVQFARVGTRHTSALWLTCRLIEQAHLTPPQAEAYLRRYVDQIPGGGDDYPLRDALNCLAWAAQHVGVVQHF